MEAKDCREGTVEQEKIILSNLLENREKDIDLIKINKLKEKYLSSEVKEDLAKYAIISFILEYNTFNRIWNNKSHKKLAKELIKNYNKNDIINNSLKAINKTIIEPSPFRAIISFRKIISKDKSHLELYFKLMMLNQNIKHIIFGIKKLLNIQDESIFLQLEELDLRNPYAIILTRDIVNDLILKDSNLDSKNILENAIQNINNYLFHCPKCKEILYYNNNLKDKPKFTCINEHNFNEDDIINFKKTIELNLECRKCKKIIKIFENNYICMNCKQFFCKACFDEHRKQNMNNILIDIYNLGYLCPEHFQQFIQFCPKCNMNLCKYCLINHYHKKEETKYIINEDLLQKFSNKNLDEIKEFNEYIISRLTLIFSFMNDFNLSHQNIQLGLWFSHNNIDIKNPSDYYFREFFSDNFKLYYKKLIDKALIGKKEKFESLLLIKQKYILAQKNINSSFNLFETDYKLNYINRIHNIKDWNIVMIDVLSFVISNKKIMDQIDNLKSKYNIINLDNKINLLKIKMLSLIRTNNVYNSYLMKIVNRYLSDILIRKIITKYPNNFENIKLSYKNIYDIFNNNKESFINPEDVIKSILELKEKFNIDNSILLLPEKEKNAKIEEIFNSIKDKNQIYVKSPIFIKDKQISVNEMKFLFAFLFCIKFEGNIITHPNISLDKAINLKQVSIDLDNIDHAFNSLIDNKNISDSTPNEKKIANKITKDVFKNIKYIKDEIEKDFNETFIKKDINIIDILNCIINNDFNNLFLVNHIFVRELFLDIKEYIKKFDIKIKFDEKSLVEEYTQNINDKLEIINEKEKEYKNFKIEINDKIYKNINDFITDSFNDNLLQTKEGINQLKDGLYFIVNQFSKYLKIIKYKEINNLENCEKEALIISILIPKIKKIILNNLEKTKSIYYDLIENNNVLESINKILEQIYLIIDPNIKKHLQKENIIDKTKSFIKLKKDKNIYSELLSLDINENRIIEMIKLLIDENDIEWIT